MIIIKSIFKWFPVKNLVGITIFPFIIFSDSKYLNDISIINHEKIHLTQQKELLIIPFFLIYGLNYLINFFKYKNAKHAYLNIIFEREAYLNENDIDYLSTRKLFNFIKYI